MKIFVTGHRGYIGSHLVDVLKQEGHTVIGCDLGLFQGCNWEPLVDPDRRADQGRPHGRGPRPGRLRLRHAPGGDLQRPDGRPQRPAHLRHQPGRLDPPGRDGQAGRRAAVPLRRELLDLRQGGEARPRRGRPAQPADRLRQVQDRDRAGRLRAGRRVVQPGLPPQRHGLRPLADAADRPGGQQPAGLGHGLRRDPDPVRRLALAAADPLPRHRPRVRRLRPGAPGKPSTTRPSTWAATGRTTRSGTSATRSSG